MKVILAGGAGQLGRLLTRELTRDGHVCLVLTRETPRLLLTAVRYVGWDGADTVINFAGRGVNCRAQPSRGQGDRGPPTSPGPCSQAAPWPY